MPQGAKLVPYTGPYSVDGYGKHKGNTAIALKRAMSRLGYLPWAPEKWDDHFNEKLEAALDKWNPGRDGYAEGRWTKLRNTKAKDGSYALDSVCIKLIQAEAKIIEVKVPNLGPVFNGGKSVLMHDCTHATGSIPLYPAFDDAFAGGTGVIAPEALEIVQASSASPGDAFYALGESKIKYWFGHLAYAPAVGRRFKKGDLLGRVAYTNVGGGSHVHVGINVENLWGAGKELIHHTNYTHGAPLIGAQLLAHAA